MTLFARTHQRISAYRRRVSEIRRSAKALGWTAPVRFALERRQSDYQSVFDKPEPLVSICITTYNKSQLLMERALASSLAQTYQNIEILVVGDCCTDDTAERMSAVSDPRIWFENLAERGRYPDDPELRWYVAGCVPFNRLLEVAKGDFITHLDHDDEYTVDRVEKLVAFSQSTRADFVYHPFLWEQDDGSWSFHEARRFDLGEVTTSSCFYHRSLASVAGDLHSYRGFEPGDWNRFRRMRFLGARTRRHPEAMLKHYKEQSDLRSVSSVDRLAEQAET